MAMFEISAPFYNPKAPKCRNCKFYIYKDNFIVGDCELKKKSRVHNDRACVKFDLINKQYCQGCGYYRKICTTGTPPSCKKYNKVLTEVNEERNDHFRLDVCDRR